MIDLCRASHRKPSLLEGYFHAGHWHSGPNTQSWKSSGERDRSLTSSFPPFPHPVGISTQTEDKRREVPLTGSTCDRRGCFLVKDFDGETNPHRSAMGGLEQHRGHWHPWLALCISPETPLTALYSDVNNRVNSRCKAKLGNIVVTIGIYLAWVPRLWWANLDYRFIL